MLLYADGTDRGANFEKDGLLCNKLLELPEENLSEVIVRVIKQKASQLRDFSKSQTPQITVLSANKIS
jgi:hypothetical protein